MSSQIGYVICLADVTNKVNIIHQLLIKCKQIMRSVLAVELYRMVYRFNIAAVIKAMLGKILEFAILLILYIDSKSLYNCLIKLDITQEKRLMVDVMSLRQLYERQEITKVKWIYGHYNPVDSMTKVKPSAVLKILINTNHINISITE